LVNGLGLGFVRGTALGDQRADHVGDLQQSLAHMRLIGETLV
jgi:hypothetical protein